MFSTPRYIRLLGVSLILVGVLLTGVGAYQERTYQCQSGYLLSVEQRSSNATGGDVVTYRNLSTFEQQAFRTALNGTKTLYESIEPIEDLNGKIVTYRRNQYNVHILAQDCGSPGLIALLPGVALAIAGIIVFGVAQALLWWRGN